MKWVQSLGVGLAATFAACGSADTEIGGGNAGGSGGDASCDLEVDAASIALSVGHADVLSVRYCHESLQLFVSEDTGAVRAAARGTERVLVQGGDNALLPVPEQPAYSFLGQPGALVYLFPESVTAAFDAGVVWPGYQSHGVPFGLAVGDSVTVRLALVDGPGEVFLFHSPQDEFSPPERLLDSAGGLHETELSADSHTHMNWAFTEPGLYRLSLQASIVRASDNLSIVSRVETLRFLLGEFAALPADQPTVIELAGAQDSYSTGDMLALTALRHGAASAPPTSWLKACFDVDGQVSPWVSISEGDTLSLPVENCFFRAEIVSPDGERLASSQDWLPLIQ